MELRLAAQRSAVRVARRWVVRCADAAAVPAAVVPVLELLTSELVANAVVHGPSDGVVTVRAEPRGGEFLVRVGDEAQGLPAVLDNGPDVPGGQGVRLVDTLATEWGVEMHRDGNKTVWFRLEH
jgi:anti-sigma regulatory factor (Ser/Thr protein kinase)